MNTSKSEELFKRYEGNPILTPADWPYEAGAVFNPGAIVYKDEVLLLVRVEDRQGHSHLTTARSRDGRSNWQIDSKPTLMSEPSLREAAFGLEDPRIVWVEDRREYLITCVSFADVVAGEPPTLSFITTKDFSSFERLERPVIPPDKDASIFPRTFAGRYALIHRPIVEGRADIWLSFSPDLKYWGEHRVLMPARHRSWDAHKVGLGPPPIETPEGWLIIYHGVRITASGNLYRTGLALLEPETLRVTHRSKEWVLAPRERYEMMGDAGNVVFACGAVVDERTRELLLYYGAADSSVALAVANLEHILSFLKSFPEP